MAQLKQYQHGWTLLPPLKAGPQNWPDLSGHIAMEINQPSDSLENVPSKEEMKNHQDLKDGDERYHRMIEEVEDYAILMIATDGTILNWNRGAERIKGYSEAEIIGRNFRIFYQPEDQQSGLPEKLIGLAIEKGKAMNEGWRVRKDGTRFWGSIVITAIHDREGNLIGFSKVTRDLTERKKAEDQLRRYAADLEFQNAELQQFASVAAHDMKEPLRKVQIYNSAILDNAAEQLSEKERQYLMKSIDAVNRMNGLIDDLLTYSKISVSGERFGWIDLNSVWQDVKQTYQDVIEKNNVMVSLTGPLPEISGIKFQLRQLLDNLLNNALKYRHPQRPLELKITCEITSGLPHQTFIDDHSHDYYKISFEDNGIGFNPQFGKKIFDMFQRLHVRNEYPGTGIGLSICQKVVQNHKGHIKAIGKQDEGARFEVYLPICTKA